MPLRILTLLTLVTLSCARAAGAQTPSTATLAALDDGTRIRTNGPGVRDLIKPTLGDVLQRGILSLVIRPPVEGVVVSTTGSSLSFTEARHSRMVEVPWSEVDWVDVYGGRSVPLGFAEGALAGAGTGFVMWGLIELIFLAADNPVVDEPEVLIGITAAAGALAGAALLGDRWDRAYPGPARE